MEGTVLTIKLAIFLAMEMFVIGTLGAALIAGLVQIIRSKVNEARYLGEVVPEVRRVTRW
jgi:hypothetical protein